MRARLALLPRPRRRSLVVGGGAEGERLASLLRVRFAPLAAVQTEADALAAVGDAPVVILLATVDDV